jgi:hypothetical protein
LELGNEKKTIRTGKNRYPPLHLFISTALSFPALSGLPVPAITNKGIVSQDFWLFLTTGANPGYLYIDLQNLIMLSERIISQSRLSSNWTVSTGGSETEVP